ncbi:MAG TPA: GNAT family N-acetyltransferase [Pyrinomonadaceae bacterium]|nr:GNAT family N-acetyltransferase [Pyrinomonadaceae bacterium]
MAELEANHGVLIRELTAGDWRPLERLWNSLYEHQRAHGMLLEVPPQGYELWIKSLQPLLGRFAFVFVAEESNSIVGFLAGRLRAAPSQFGGAQLGHVSEVFVSDSHRQRGIGGALLTAATDWFRKRGIRHVDLPVLANNLAGREFYRSHGWIEDVVQMVWREPTTP